MIKLLICQKKWALTKNSGRKQLILFDLYLELSDNDYSGQNCLEEKR